MAVSDITTKRCRLRGFSRLIIDRTTSSVTSVMVASSEKLEEARPRVLGISDPGRIDHPPAVLGGAHHLGEGKSCEEEVESAEYDHAFKFPERSPCRW